jgi:hypothetical protein
VTFTSFAPDPVSGPSPSAAPPSNGCSIVPSLADG